MLRSIPLVSLCCDRDHQLFTLLGYVLPRHAGSNLVGGHDVDSRELSSGRERLVEKANGLEERRSKARSLRE